MTLLAVTLAALAAVLIMPSSPGRRVLDRLTAGGQVPVRQVGRRRWLVLVPLGVAVVVVAGTLGGGRGAAYATAGVIMGGLALRMIMGGGRRGRSIRAEAEIADACRALANEVRVGKIPADALASAAVDHPVLADADRADRLGADVADLWRRQSRLPGHAGLLHLARGWEVCRATGAPLSVVLDQIADSLGADQTVRLMVAGELAAPRASGKIMAVLPLLGIGLGYLIGGDPLAFLWREPVGWACLVGGTLLAAAGILWVDALARQAEHE
ncbi:type II secretion system F family protein [Microlunatus sp. GCM10028923]|uniref:type II secretion system F family protein n=1 Tax=Microlunatus sp. GCM10028923 TaxID=3273400 RepID=UPI0036129479